MTNRKNFGKRCLFSIEQVSLYCVAFSTESMKRNLWFYVMLLSV